MNRLTDQEQGRKDAAMLAAEGANDELPEVEDIRRITYNPDDTIVLRVRNSLSAQALDRLSDQISRQFEGRKVIVLDAGMTLDVMAPEDEEGSE